MVCTFFGEFVCECVSYLSLLFVMETTDIPEKGQEPAEKIQEPPKKKKRRVKAVPPQDDDAPPLPKLESSKIVVESVEEQLRTPESSPELREVLDIAWELLDCSFGVPKTFGDYETTLVRLADSTRGVLEGSGVPCHVDSDAFFRDVHSARPSDKENSYRSLAELFLVSVKLLLHEHVLPATSAAACKTVLYERIEEKKVDLSTYGCSRSMVPPTISLWLPYLRALYKKGWGLSESDCETEPVKLAQCLVAICDNK